MMLIMEMAWILSWVFITLSEDITPTPLVSSSTTSRSLRLDDKQDTGNYQSSYFPYPIASYGPPPTEPTTEYSLHLEFAFDEIILKCVVEEPLEHIIWTRYKCPQQFQYGGEGIHIADGSKVYQDNLYDVHIRGHDGIIISELLLKDPLSMDSEGIYQCEAWPHVHRGGAGGHSPYGYQPYVPPKSNVFIIGGNTLLEDCFHISNFGTQTFKQPSFSNKIDARNEKDNKVNRRPPVLKLKKHMDSRIHSNSKRPRYSLKFLNNTLYNVDGNNVTTDYFYPISKKTLDLKNDSFV